MRRKDGAKKVSNNVVSKNLARLLGSGTSFADNLRHIEHETGISQSAVRNWIAGHRNPQLASLKKIAELYHFDIYTLFDEPDNGDLLPEHKAIIEAIPKVKNKAILEAIQSMIRVGLLDRNDSENDSESENKGESGPASQ